MKKNTFKVLFYLRGNQVNKAGKASIMIRITIDGEIEQLNSKLYVEPDLWDSKAGKAIGRSAKILELNNRLNDIQVLCELNPKSWTKESLKNVRQGKKKVCQA